MKQHISLSFDEDFLNRIKIVCRKKKTTINKMIQGYLEKVVQQEDGYKDAWESIKALMEQRPIRVGRKTWTRQDLHER
jgi:hypothetical protein